jgi:hypothetical protein
MSARHHRALHAWRRGDAGADELMRLVYLTSTGARRAPGRAPRPHAAADGAGAQAYLRLVDQRRVDWRPGPPAIAAVDGAALDHARKHGPPRAAAARPRSPRIRREIAAGPPAELGELEALEALRRSTRKGGDRRAALLAA